MIGLKQRDMENIVDLELGWKLQPASHYTDKFNDFERSKALVIQLGTWAGGSNVLSKKPDLVSNLEVWMVLTSVVCLLLLALLCELELCHKVMLNMSKPLGPLFSQGVY
jgi:hypothetical protein